MNEIARLLEATLPERRPLPEAPPAEPDGFARALAEQQDLAEGQLPLPPEELPEAESAREPLPPEAPRVSSGRIPEPVPAEIRGVDPVGFDVEADEARVAMAVASPAPIPSADAPRTGTSAPAEAFADSAQAPVAPPAAQRSAAPIEAETVASRRGEERALRAAVAEGEPVTPRSPNAAEARGVLEPAPQPAAEPTRRRRRGAAGSAAGSAAGRIE